MMLKMAFLDVVVFGCFVFIVETISKHLNNKKVKVRFSDVSAIQIFAI